ncbi:MAG: OmpP1/FadL family transporter [Pseudomonadota bacterium]
MGRKITKMAVALAASSVLTTSAIAGGLERGGYNIDLLFDESRFSASASTTYVMPRRELNNVVDRNPVNGVGANGIGGGATDGVKSTESYLVPRFGVKIGLGNSIDCMGDYSQPYGGDDNPGAEWAGANDNIRTFVESTGFAATCSYKFDVGPGSFRIIGGVSHLEITGFKDRLVAPVPVLAPGAGTGVGRLELEGNGIGWRVGAAFEIPEIALRASLMYYSEVEIDDVTGNLDLTQVPGALNPANPLLGRNTPIFGSSALPEVVELKVQSGIAPGWLAFGSVKWVDWGQLQSIPFCPESTRSLAPCTSGGPTEVTSLDLNYRDGWTISGGVGHAFNDQLAVAASLTWDRGTSTGTGAQTDSYAFAAGIAITPNETSEFRIGGAFGVLTSGSSMSDDVSYDFGNDLVGAISASFKAKF